MKESTERKKEWGSEREWIKMLKVEERKMKDHRTRKEGERKKRLLLLPVTSSHIQLLSCSFLSFPSCPMSSLCVQPSLHSFLWTELIAEHVEFVENSFGERERDIILSFLYPSTNRCKMRTESKKSEARGTKEYSKSFRSLSFSSFAYSFHCLFLFSSSLFSS